MRRIFAVLGVVTIIGLLLSLVLPSGRTAPARAQTSAGQRPPTQVVTATDQAARKIHPKLKARAASLAAGQDIEVLVRVKAGTNLSRYMRRALVRPFIDPTGAQAVVGTIKAGTLNKLAGVSEVLSMQLPESIVPPPQPLDPDGRRISPSKEAIQQRLAQIRSGGTAQPQGFGGPQPADWFDVLDNHKSKLAWDKGFTGKGVKAMVNDTGIDFAHPDLQGTQARVADPASPYYGWPEQFDTFSMYLWARDVYLDEANIAAGFGDYADTSATCKSSPCSFQPIGASSPHAYALPATSQSGIYRVGNHPDNALQYWWYGERVAVLVVDETTAGVYDTVYVDLDADYDFTDEKPARRGDEIAAKDLDGDLIADVSGGLVYFIADGVNPIPASDWMWGLGVPGNGAHDFGEPENGSLVAFAINDPTEVSGDHGTLVASAIAGQGVINGAAPPFKPPYSGPGTGMVLGGGKDVRLVSNGNFFMSPFFEDPFLFSALGYDGIPGTEDDVQIVNNSWGCSNVDNDGWDDACASRTIDLIMRRYGRTMSVTKSTGNGGPGYGTITSPSGPRIIDVGASTQMGSSGDWDSLTSIDQITYGDVATFSNRGPTATGDNGPDVVASGAFAPGSMPLNEIGDGWNAWYDWGGTSRAAPITAGNLALIYQAYRDKYGVWPDTLTARALLMSGADDIHYDTLVQGAGLVNADRATENVSGQGFFVTPDHWSAGSYRGAEYPAFANIMLPGQSDTQTFIVRNSSASDRDVSLRTDTLRRIGEMTFDWTTADISQEDRYNFYRPGYLRDITPDIPPGTDLMIIRATFPYDEFDRNGDYSADQRWILLAYDWKDVDGDGKLWQDLDGNGTVNGALGEVDAGEYMRFTYGFSRSDNQTVSLQRPLERMHDGIFLGLQHVRRTAAIPQTHVKMRIEFYQHSAWGLVSLSASSLTVPTGGVSSFSATMSVPADAPYGVYEGAVLVDDGTHQTVVPVVASVAARGPDFAFGGTPRSSTPYDNGAIFGGEDWGWRAEAGDWRFYFTDLPGPGLPQGEPFDNRILVDTRWETTPTDVDTIVMGPTPDDYSAFDLGYYGPYTLETTGKSLNTNVGAGVWNFQTATGGAREIISAPYIPGLNLIALHNVLFAGGDFSEGVTGKVGTITVKPSPIKAQAPVGTRGGKVQAKFSSSLPLSGLVANAFGLGARQVLSAQTVRQDDPNDPATAGYRKTISLSRAGRLDVSTGNSPGNDIDLYLLFDKNGDGAFDFSSEVIGASTTPYDAESVSVRFPADGNYLIAVLGWWVPAGTATFDLTVNAVQGNDVTVTGLPTGPIVPGQIYYFTVRYNVAGKRPGTYLGLVTLGPREAPGAIEVPVTVEVVR